MTFFVKVPVFNNAFPTTKNHLTINTPHQLGTAYDQDHYLILEVQLPLVLMLQVLYMSDIFCNEMLISILI